MIDNDGIEIGIPCTTIIMSGKLASGTAHTGDGKETSHTILTQNTQPGRSYKTSTQPRAPISFSKTFLRRIQTDFRNSP